MEEEANIVESEEPTKEELERKKLLLEIEELKKKWWKKPTYIGAAFPTLLAIITLVYGFANGYFQASFVKLENQKYALQNEIRAFEGEKADLKRQVNELTEEREQRQKAMREALDSLEKSIHELPPINNDKSLNEKEPNKLRKQK